MARSKFSRADLREAHALINAAFPYGPFPSKFKQEEGPALWVFQLRRRIAEALAKRSRAKFKE